MVDFLKQLLNKKPLSQSQSQSQDIKSNSECDHDPHSPNTTLIKSKRSNMLYPKTADYICTKCNKDFSFTDI